MVASDPFRACILPNTLDPDFRVLPMSLLALFPCVQVHTQLRQQCSKRTLRQDVRRRERLPDQVIPRHPPVSERFPNASKIIQKLCPLNHIPMVCNRNLLPIHDSNAAACNSQRGS